MFNTLNWYSKIHEAKLLSKHPFIVVAVAVAAAMTFDHTLTMHESKTFEMRRVGVSVLLQYTSILSVLTLWRLSVVQIKHLKDNICISNKA